MDTTDMIEFTVSGDRTPVITTSDSADNVIETIRIEFNRSLQGKLKYLAKWATGFMATPDAMVPSDYIVSPADVDLLLDAIAKAVCSYIDKRRPPMM
jgi:hypothetical protein